ncbi:twin-arginine translocation signal domain-containing protein [Pseudomonas putida]|nr:twin-arginine translocation signal domain-containing protein [Pseudomonas putida]
MGKLTFCTAQLGRRGFLQRCVLLGVGGAVFGASASVAGKPVEQPGFVVINGWVLPSRYFRNEPA